MCYYIQRLRRMTFIRCSVKESGTPPEFWGPLGKLPTWCLSLCGCSSSGHHAWPYTCACKHTRRHTRLRFAMQQLTCFEELLWPFNTSLKGNSHQFYTSKSLCSKVCVKNYKISAIKGENYQVWKRKTSEVIELERSELLIYASS